MDWREALKIEDPHWIGIGKYIADVTQNSLDGQNKSGCDLTNYLRSVGNQHIEPDFVQEYLSGSASFGCFFPQFRDFLGITSKDVFRNVSEEEAQRDLKSLDDYLTDTHNKESLVIFMKHKPGEELRKHVAALLTEKREAALNKPYHTMDLGLDPEEDTNRYMEDRRQLLKFVKESVRGLSEPLELSLSSDTKTTELVPQNNQNALYDGIMGRMKANFENNPSAYWNSPIIPGSRIVVQPAAQRGRVGVTIDFLYPDGEYFDKNLSECPEGHSWLKDQFVGLEAWKEAYTNGTFNTLQDSPDRTQKIANIMASLHGGVNEFTPTREPTPAERYELHQRWVWSGGRFMPGPNIKG
ncbi:MAG: hypothetical protein WCI72_05630, partial [archaeon]